MAKTMQTIRRRGAAIVLGLLVGFVLAELGLRLLGVRPPRMTTKLQVKNRVEPLRKQYLCYTTNPNGEFEPTPAFDDDTWVAFRFTNPVEQVSIEAVRDSPWCVDMSRSEQFLRDRVYSEVPPPGIVRIAGIGDSFALGEGVPLDRSLFKQVEAKLGDGFEVINFANSGTSIKTQLPLLKRVSQTFHCDRAIVVFIANDVPKSREMYEKRSRIYDLINFRDMYLESHAPRSWYARRLRVVELIESHLQMKQIREQTIQWYLDMYDPKNNLPGLAHLFTQFKELADMPTCRVLLVLYPLMDGLEGDYPLASIHKTVTEIATGAGLPVLDLAPMFNGQDSRSLQVHPADHHPNGKAHAIASDAIVQFLRNDMSDFLTPTNSSPPPPDLDPEKAPQNQPRP